MPAPYLDAAFARRYLDGMEKPDLEQLAARLERALPEQLRNARDDFETNVRPLADSFLRRLDLVTREEFEVQRGVLERTREKVERLETLVAELERRRR